MSDRSERSRRFRFRSAQIRRCQARRSDPVAGGTTIVSIENMSKLSLISRASTRASTDSPPDSICREIEANSLDF